MRGAMADKTDDQLAATPSLNVAVFNTCLQQGNEVCKDVVHDLHLIRLCDEQRTQSLHDLRQTYESARGGGSLGPVVLDNISRNLNDLMKLSNASVQLADVAYTQLDVSMLMLDRKLKLMESLLRKQVDITSAQLTGAAARSEGSRPPRIEALRESIVGTSSVAALALPDGRAAPRGSGSGRGGRGLRSMAGGTIDLAVDEDEPTYCSCDQVAFGEMIACDNPSCTTEWYHCLCVGITPANKPSGQWLCPACTRAGSEGQDDERGMPTASAGGKGSAAVEPERSSAATSEPVKKKARQNL